MLAERSLPPEAWCRVIGAIELGLNTAVAESTGKPPALGAFEELPRLPVDLVVGAEAPVGVIEVSQQVKTIGRKLGSSWKRHKRTRRGTMIPTITIRSSHLATRCCSPPRKSACQAQGSFTHARWAHSRSSSA